MCNIPGAYTQPHQSVCKVPGAYTQPHQGHIHTDSVCDPPLTHSHTTPYTQILCVTHPLHTATPRTRYLTHSVFPELFPGVYDAPQTQNRGTYTQMCSAHPHKACPVRIFENRALRAPVFENIDRKRPVCMCPTHVCMCPGVRECVYLCTTWLHVS